VIRVEVLLLVVVIATVSLILFFRAYFNWRTGTRMRDHSSSVRLAAEEEMQRLQAEMEATRRRSGRDVTRGEE
jgi:Flp pilus assembly protein TadB